MLSTITCPALVWIRFYRAAGGPFLGCKQITEHGLINYWTWFRYDHTSRLHCEDYGGCPTDGAQFCLAMASTARRTTSRASSRGCEPTSASGITGLGCGVHRKKEVSFVGQTFYATCIVPVKSFFRGGMQRASCVEYNSKLRVGVLVRYRRCCTGRHYCENPYVSLYLTKFSIV